MDSQLRVLSFNCWGLKYVAKHRQERVGAIAAELSKSQYDLVGLQEIWVFADYELIRSAVSKRLPFSKFFHSGALGAGLAIFSRFPILTGTIFPYSLNGSPLDVAGGDWIVGKAAASVVVQHPVLGILEVFNTHFHARGGEDGPEFHRAHRISNAWEFTKLTRQSAERGRCVIAMGDLNSTPKTLPMAVIMQHAGLQDAWITTHPASANVPDMSPLPSPIQAIHEWGMTCDSPLNTYSFGKPLSHYAKKYNGKRLDYILYRSPSSEASSHQLDCIESRVVLSEKVPGRAHSFSDHFAVEATFTASARRVGSRDGGDPLHDAFGVHEPTIEAMLQALTLSYRFSRSRSRSYMTLFAICLTLLVFLIVGSAWLPRSWINPIFLLLTVTLSWLATTMFYVGFVFGRWEVGALTNIIEELELLKRRSSRTLVGAPSAPNYL